MGQTKDDIDEVWRNLIDPNLPATPENLWYPPKELIREQFGANLDGRLSDIETIVSSGVHWVDAARVASTANVTLASAVENGDTLDGVVLATGDRILLKNQTTGGENGVWVVAASGAPTRATDADDAAELVGLGIFVRFGTVNGGKQFVQVTPATIVVGTTALVFNEISDQTALNANLVILEAEVDVLQDEVDVLQALRVTMPGIDVNGESASEVIVDDDNDIIVAYRSLNTGIFYRADGPGWIADRVSGPPAIPKVSDAIFDTTGGGTPSRWSSLFGSCVRAENDEVFDIYLQLGQSWDVGNNGAAPGQDRADTFTTTELDPDYLWMLTGFGINPNGHLAGGIEPAQEGTTYAFSRESGMVQMGFEILNRIEAATGSRRKVALTDASYGGQGVECYRRGGKIYQWTLDQIKAIADIARSQGLRPIVRAMFTRSPQANALSWTAEFIAQMFEELLHDLTDDVRGITGQTERIIGVAIQIQSSTTGIIKDNGAAYWPLVAQKRGRGWYCAGPSYALEGDYDPALGFLGTEGAHLSTYGYATAGKFQGVVAHELLFRTGWQPVRILTENIRWISTGATPVVELTYNKAVMIDSSGNIVDDTGVVAAGFDLYDDAGAVTINSVAVVANNGTMNVVGQDVTIGGTGISGTGSAIAQVMGADPWACAIHTATRTFAIADEADYGTAGNLAIALAALIPGATVAGLTITLPGGTVPTSAAWYSNRIRLTLAAKPGNGLWRLYYAHRQTGAVAVGADMGGRGLVRSLPELTTIVDINAVTQPIFAWACCERIDLPRY